MPFATLKQMIWMKHNRPKIYTKWTKKYGVVIGDKAKKKVKKNQYTEALASAK